jgi:hypothetical protein
VQKFSLLILVTIMAAPAQAQGKVTLSELQGRMVRGEIVMERVMRRGGREFPVKTKMDWKLKVQEGDAVWQEMRSTVTGPRGTRDTDPLTGTFPLGKSVTVRSRGGGEAMYSFSDGTLTFVRTFKKGAFRKSTAFARGGDGNLTCEMTASHAREEGTGAIELVNPFDGQPMSIVSYKQVSSSCDVAADKS